MRIGAVLSPVADWDLVAGAARAADELGFDAVALWDHYHSPRPEWGYVSGWAALGALVRETSGARLAHMVLNNLHYEPGVLAKESSTLALASNGRFELAIGAGDWPESFAAWGRPFPPRSERITRLDEAVEICRRAWRGDTFDFEGRYNTLSSAACTPAPDAPPRVIVGVGASRAMAESAVRYADELNVYADDRVLDQALALIDDSGRDVAVSMFFSWEWQKWPTDPRSELERWNRLGVERFFVSLGSNDMPARLEQLAPLITG